MISHTTEQFRKLFTGLPKEIQKQAKEAYAHFKKDHFYPGLQLKRVHSTRPIYSARISKDYRVVGIQQNSTIIWFWIGSHSDYEKILKKLRHI